MNELIRTSAWVLLPLLAMCASATACDPEPTPAPEAAATFRNNALFCDAYHGQTVTMQSVRHGSMPYLYEAGDTVALSNTPQFPRSSMHWRVHCEDGNIFFQNAVNDEWMIASPPGMLVFLTAPFENGMLSAWARWTAEPDPSANPQEFCSRYRFHHWHPGQPTTPRNSMDGRGNFLKMTNECNAASTFQLCILDTATE